MFSIITNDTVEKQFENCLIHIIEISWHEETVCFYDTQNRWKAYHVSPYEETIVLDTDMLFLSDPSITGIYLIGTMFVLLKKLEHTKMKQ